MIQKLTVTVNVLEKNYQLNDFLFLNPWATWLKEADPQDVMYMQLSCSFLNSNLSCFHKVIHYTEIIKGKDSCNNGTSRFHDKVELDSTFNLMEVTDSFLMLHVMCPSSGFLLRHPFIPWSEKVQSSWYYIKENMQCIFKPTCVVSPSVGEDESIGKSMRVLCTSDGKLHSC